MSQPEYMPRSRGVTPPPPPRRKVRKQPPQKTVDDFWASFTTSYPGKVLSILPHDVYSKSKAAKQAKGTITGSPALKSYDEAARECTSAVEQIAHECRRVNMRYRDKHFDIEFDLKNQFRRCLDGIWGRNSESPAPRAVKRVPQIFKKPQFYIDDATAADVRQGKTGDCYLLAAVGALGNKSGLIRKVCVAKDEKVGVYGFVFHRDGEWIHTVVDDKLYLSVADYDESNVEKSNWTEISNRQNAESEYKEAFQTGSRALYFAQCNDENETWLPLLEKAYAKAHGDYDAIIGGFTGEAIEDLTGGVTTELFATDILDTDLFWKNELSRVNEEFLFGCATGLFDEWQGTNTAYRDGIYAFHAYTIMKAAEYKGERLLLVRNPWGQSEWRGRWSDGSPEWTGDSLTALDHKFGDDGMFWISFEDLLKKYQFFDRTRLFDSTWKVSQQWTTVDVPWSADYNETKFSLTLTEATRAVIVLSQLDSRYWTGLEGPYRFTLHFRLSKDGDDSYTVRSHGNYWMTRSVSTELDLEAGTYSILMKITATRENEDAVEDVVRDVCRRNQEKLLQYGLAYDLAHAKGIITETEEDKRHKSEQDAKKRKETKEKARTDAKKKKYEEWVVAKKEIERKRRQKARKEEHLRKKQAAKAAEMPKTPIDDKSPIDPKNSEDIKSPADIKSPVETVPSKTEEKLPPVAEETATEIAAGDTTQDTLKAISEASTTDTPEGSRISDDTVLVEKENPANQTANSKIAEFQQGPLVKNTGPVVPALKINDEDAKQDSVIPPPLMSPGYPPSLVAAQQESDLETVVSYDSSVDTDLDHLEVDSETEAVSGEDEGPDPANEEFSDDPWNAVCVVGLRVYSKETNVSINVVRPKSGKDEDAPLDVDDPSKGMSDEPTSPVKSEKKMVESLDDVIAGIEDMKTSV